MATKVQSDGLISTDGLVFGNLIPNGNGRFADIKFATLCRGDSALPVVAKINKVNASETDRHLMNKKMEFMDKVPAHDNVLTLMGTVPLPQGPIMLMEYCPMGKLASWLKGIAKMTTTVEDQMLSFCRQTALGMSHLHNNKILHRRLGVRNVLLTPSTSGEFVAKLTGFGPLKEDHVSFGESKKGDRVPLRWMAPEQLHKVAGQSRLYTEQTDIWSYGVFVYEVYSQGKQPYHNISDDKLKDAVIHGYRLEKPEKCPNFMFDEIMTDCWSSKTEQRPDFDRIVTAMNIYFDGAEIADEEDEDDIYVVDKDIQLFKKRSTSPLLW